MDPHHPLHNSIPSWAQPVPSHPPSSAAAVQYSSAYPDIPHPHNYAPNLHPLNYHPAPPPVQTAPSPFPVPAPNPSPAPALEAAAAPPPSGGYQPGPMASYAEMIHSAITALNEREGSSKRAISKYIEKAYSGLPETHSVLLTQNLKRLKSNGLLVMMKKSYMLPGSGFLANINDLPDTSAAAPSNPVTSPQSEVAAPATVTSPPLSQSVGPNRGRGRPPKPKPIVDGLGLPNGHPESAPSGPGPLPSPEPAVLQPMNDAMPPGFVPNGQPAQPQHFTGDINVEETAHPLNQNSEPVNVLIALVENAGEVKRRPGRPPKKLLAVDAAGVVIGKRGRGRPPKNGLGLGPKKKSPGRPRKPKPKTVADVSLGTNGYKKRPGRPPKNQANNLVLVPYASSVEVNVSVPRPRGRPRKGTGSIAAGVGVGGFLEKRSDDDVIQQLPRRSGRPVGRPRKYLEDAGTETETQGGFRTKLSSFQSRVREVYDVLNPMLNEEAPDHVKSAVEQLKKLGALDIDRGLEEQFLNPDFEQEVHMEEPVPVEN